MSGSLRNWAGNITYRADAVCYPASVTEVQNLVARSPHVKALGTRHSFSSVADCPGGVLVSLAQLAPDISIDTAARTVSVTGGTCYGTLAAVLHARGYALHNTGSLPLISIAGATATGTHGSGDHNGILATAIVALDVVVADGSLVTIDRADPDLRTLAVGIGAFVVITRLVLEIQPTYLVRQDVYRNAPWDTVLRAFDAVMGSAYSVSLLGDFGESAVRELWLKARLDALTDDVRGRAPAPQEVHGGRWYDDGEERVGHSLNVRSGVPGPWSERLPHFRLDAPPSVGGDELQTEYFIDRRHAVGALSALRSMAPNISPHPHGAEIRTVAADDLFLSPAYRRDSVCIGFTWQRHPMEVLRLLPAIEACLEQYEPRPHWGKLFAMDETRLAMLFPRLSDVIHVKSKYDPSNKFHSQYINA